MHPCQIGFAEHFNWPAAGDSNVDSIRPKIQKYTVFSRPASAVEPTDDLRRPRFSTCVLPVLLIANWIYNSRCWSWSSE